MKRIAGQNQDETTETDHRKKQTLANLPESPLHPPRDKMSVSQVNGKFSALPHDAEVIPFPLDVWEEIFLNLPPHFVVCVCRLVCNEWKDVADSESFWKERCRREGYHLNDPTKVPRDWRMFYFLSKNRRNLIKNPRGEDGFQRWNIVQNGGDKWSLENPRLPHPNPAVKKTFVTSYYMCMKEQLIDLEKEGYSPSFMDEIQPHIRISDWYAPRWDCGSIYEISVQLLDKNKRIVKTFSPEQVSFPQWNDQQWNQMVHVFKDYGPGVRYVNFCHGGRDTQFWAGHYGIRVTESCVEVCPALET
uniref:F-box only protein 44-like n=1 Tax=Cyprinodon variegatus TaxID=28743 RepID=A0A3Q2CDW5_CYPVA